MFRSGNDRFCHVPLRQVGHDAGIAGGGNHRNIDALFQRFDAGPASCALLSCRIDDFINDLSARFIIFSKNIGGDADEDIDDETDDLR